MKRLIWTIVIICVIGGFGVFYSLREHQKTDILVVLSLTGAASGYGQYAHRGVELWLQDHPEFKHRVKVVDAQSSPQTALTVFQQEIARSKPKYAVVATTALVNALRPIAEKEKIFIIATTVTAASPITKGMIQRMNPSNIDSVHPTGVIFARESIRPAMLYSSEDYGLSTKASVEAILSKEGKALIHNEGYDLRDSNVRDMVGRIIAKKPDNIYVAGFGNAYLNVLEALRRQGYTGGIFTDSGLSNPVQLERLQKADAKIFFVGTDMELTSSNNEIVNSFKQRYNKEFHSKPCFVVACAYDSLSIVKTMEEKSILSQEQLSELGRLHGLVGPVDLLPQGECHYPTKVLTVDSKGVHLIGNDGE